MVYVLVAHVNNNQATCGAEGCTCLGGLHDVALEQMECMLRAVKYCLNRPGPRPAVEGKGDAELDVCGAPVEPT